MPDEEVASTSTDAGATDATKAVETTTVLTGDVAGKATDGSALPPLVGPDGKLAKDWKTRIPEEYRQEKCLDIVGEDFNNLVKNYVYTQKMRGKKQIAIPTETSSQMEWDAFHEAIGRPKEADGYKFEKDPALPDEAWNPGTVQEFKQLAWEIGLTPQQVARLNEFENKRALSYVKSEQEADAETVKLAEIALRKDWGSAYDERLHLANLFIAKTTEEGEQRDTILQLAGSNPAFIKWVSEWGEKVAESRGIDTSQLRHTPRQEEDRMKELMATPGYVDGRLKRENPYQFEKIKREIAEIAERMTAQQRKQPA